MKGRKETFKKMATEKNDVKPARTWPIEKIDQRYSAEPDSYRVTIEGSCNRSRPSQPGNGQPSLMTRVITLLIVSLLAAVQSPAADKPSFVVGWSVYVGWNPWYYMQKSGILKKWADKYNVAIRVQRFDYAPSLDAFVAKNIDACAMTNMEALDMPAAANIDTTSIITGDYSNGNDALLTRRDLQLNQLAGHKALLVQKTVSEYLFERAMTLNGLES
jgi:NitT/TauT family transport system substrate-binding protein